MRRGLAVLLLMMVCLPGCKKTAGETKQIETAIIYERGQGFSEKGITYIQDSVVQFTDFATGETMPLCSRPNCAHRGLTAEEAGNGAEGCMAYVENAYQAVLYREKLYVFTEESNRIGIYVSDADGSNRKLLAELLDSHFLFGFSTQFYDNRIAMLVSEREVSKADDGTMEMKSLRRLVCIDCETGNVLNFDKKWEQPVSLYGIDGDAAYVYEAYTLQEVYSLYTEEELKQNPELIRPYQRAFLWQCSLTDGVTTELFAGKLGADYSVSSVNRAGAVLNVHKLHEEEKKVYFSFAAQEEKVIPLEKDARVLQMEDGSILFSRAENTGNGTEGAIYRYFCDSGEAKKLEMDSSLVPVRMLGGKLYCLKDEMTTVVSLEDVLNGKSEACYQTKRVIYQQMR